MSSQLQNKPAPVNAGIQGYRSNEPANSPWNKQILSYHAARVPYTVQTQASESETSQPDKSYSFSPSANMQGLPSSSLVSSVPSQPQKSSNPELESAILGSFKSNTGAWAKGGQAFSTYLGGLYQKGILTDSDIDQLNKQADIFNAGVEKQNAAIRNTNFTNALQNQQKLENVLTQAKTAGANSLNVLDSSGKIIGTVNPQNIGIAKLQATKLLMGVGGSGSLQGSVTKSQIVSGTNTIQKTPSYKNDPFSMFVRPVLSFGASVGEQILSDIRVGRPQGSTGLQVLQGMFSGKPVSETSQDVSQKLENTFGLSNEVEQIKSGNISLGQKIAGIAGIAAAVTIPTIAGMGGLGKVPEFEAFAEKISPLIKTSAKTVQQNPQIITRYFQENPLELHEANIGLTKELSQGTELQVTPSKFQYEKAPIQVAKLSSKVVKSEIKINPEKIVSVSEKIPEGTNVFARESVLPKGISLTRPVSTVGPKGEELIKEIPNFLQTGEKEAGEAVLPYAYISKEQTAFVRSSPSKLPGQKFLVSGNPKPEVISTLGLEPVKGIKNMFISKTLTKGMQEYLGYAEKAGLITNPLSEIHVYPTKDILASEQTPGVYVMASRNPEILKGNEFGMGGIFEDITRPEVIKYHEAYPIKLQTFEKREVKPVKFKPMKPFTSEKSDKTEKGEPSASLLEEVTKQESKTVNEPNLFRTFEEKKSFEPRFMKTAFSEAETQYIRKNVRDRFETMISGKQGISLGEELNIKSDISNVFRTDIEEKLKSRTRMEHSLIPLTITTPKEDLFTSTAQRTRSMTQTMNAEVFPNPSGNTPVFVPHERKRLPPIFPPWFPNPAEGNEGPVGGGGKKKGYVGNVPEFQFTGMYNRATIIYGNPKTPKMPKQKFNIVQSSPENKGRKTKKQSKKFRTLI